ncbi:hypothetical protein EPK99_17200 [Neorhizobium lilium]|uniref:Uncharacterized protein n=1 Tax=Neorhizobium lilium TaxID=2503024 RepID=A0A3S4UJU3_9HYPH|nr:hypothetical protein [Neorhizobium lilium]RWX75439.1 hypothetical protein EPK99_17200 [Neorhizobium lilium]
MPGTNAILMFLAFDRNARGDAIPAFEPLQAASAAEAIDAADKLAEVHAGAVAWRRDVQPAVGEMGEPIILFQRGLIGDFN